MNYRLTVLPAIEISSDELEFEFKSRSEAIAAKETCADLLLFIQDKLKLMNGYSNVFYIEEKIDNGEWIEIEED